MGVLAVLAVAPARAHADDGGPLVALVDAATQRLQTADPVAANKWHTKGPIEDPPRVQQILDGVTGDATARGIDPEAVRRIFTDQVDATEAIEYSRFAQWKLDPAAAPATAPDLSSSRAVIDGLNHTMVEQLAAQWSLLGAPECRDRLTEATDTVATQRGLDPLYRQALAFATRSYCR